MFHHPYQIRRAKLEDLADVLVPLVKHILPDFNVGNPPHVFDWPLLPNLSAWTTGVFAFVFVRRITKQKSYCAVPDEGLVNGLIKQGEYIQNTLALLTSKETLQRVEDVVKEDIAAFKKCVSDNLSAMIQECYEQFKNYRNAFFKISTKLMISNFYAKSLDTSLFFALEAYKSSPGKFSHYFLSFKYHHSKM